MRSLFSALAFLTRIPVPEGMKSRKENGMFAGYPAAGLLIGGMLSLVWFLTGLIAPAAVAAVVLIGFSLFLTGAIHLDGLADCADAFYGKRDVESVLRILHDPRIGTMGGAAIGMSLMARYAAFTSLPAVVLIAVFPALTMFSRSTVIIGLRMLPYVRNVDGILTPQASIGAFSLTLALFVVVLSAALLPVPTVVALLAAIVFWIISWKKIGGSTGDVLGATIEISEIVFLLTLVAAGREEGQWGAFFPLLALLFGAGA
jgi:adenosylcobinamide-GDP ribazoletransferase